MHPESDTGNIEYKLKLLKCERVEELATQMRYRLNEGKGECFYIIGVKDNGKIEGINDEDYKITHDLLIEIASKINVSISILSSKQLHASQNKVYEYLVRETHNKYIEIKVGIAVVLIVERAHCYQYYQRVKKIMEEGRQDWLYLIIDMK